MKILKIYHIISIKISKLIFRVKDIFALDKISYYFP